MKRQLITASLMVLSAFGIQTAFAQNYQPFSRNLTYHFSARDSVYSMRVDSTFLQNGDSVFVFNKIAKFNAGTAFTPPPGCNQSWGAHYLAYGNNQFGQQMIKRPNGEYEFVTLQGSMFLLKTRASVGQTWPFNTAFNLTATLTSKTVEPVLTTTDSVLTFTLSNGDVIKLTKNYGFLKAPNFAAYSDSYFPARELNFMTLPEKQLGKNYSSPLTIYDYQPGDILSHYFTEQGSMIACLEKWTRTEITSRTMSPAGDTIYYQANRQILERRGNGCPGGPSGFNLLPVTTISWAVAGPEQTGVTALSNSYYILPSNPGSTYELGRVSQGMYADPAFNNMIRKDISHWLYNPCAGAFYSPEGYTSRSYVAGLGMVKDEHIDVMYRSLEVLQAYRKDGVVNGNLQTLSQIMGTAKDKFSTSAISIFPNPTGNAATLKFDQPLTSGPVSVSVINALGQVVLQQQFAGIPDQRLQLSLEKLTKGMYVVQVKQNDRTFSSRLVKQ